MLKITPKSISLSIPACGDGRGGVLQSARVVSPATKTPNNPKNPPFPRLIPLRNLFKVFRNLFRVLRNLFRTFRSHFLFSATCLELSATRSILSATYLELSGTYSKLSGTHLEFCFSEAGNEMNANVK